MNLVVWFYDFRSMIRYHLLNRQVSQLSDHVPARAACEALLKELQPERFNQYQVSSGSPKISVLYGNLDTYIAKIKEFTKTIKQDKLIPVDWYIITPQQISLDEFLTTSSTGYYLNIVKELALLQDVGLKLCQCLLLADTEEYGQHEHNLRILTKLFVNLRQIIMVLLKVSLAK